MPWIHKKQLEQNKSKKTTSTAQKNVEGKLKLETEGLWVNSVVINGPFRRKTSWVLLGLLTCCNGVTLSPKASVCWRCIHCVIKKFAPIIQTPHQRTPTYSSIRLKGPYCHFWLPRICNRTAEHSVTKGNVSEHLIFSGRDPDLSLFMFFGSSASTMISESKWICCKTVITVNGSQIFPSWLDFDSNTISEFFFN